MYPSLEATKALAASGTWRRIPVCRELYADRFTPVEVMRTLRAVSSHCYMLESAEAHQQWGRYTFLGYEPTLEITCSAGRVQIREREDITSCSAGRAQIREGEERVSCSAGRAQIREGEEIASDGDRTERESGSRYDTGKGIQSVIRSVLADYKSPKLDGQPPFTGGLVGYFSYEYICSSEPSLRLGGEDPEEFQDVDRMLFDRVIAFDHYRQKIILICGVSAEHPEESYRQAEHSLSELEALLKSGVKAYFPPLHLEEKLKPLFSRERYRQMVEKAKHYIHEGDIFQVVLSNPVEARAAGSLFDVYRVLRTTNPSPYMFYFTSDDIELVGASPETLVKLEDGTLHTFPLAGTRPRGKTLQEDLELERELLADEKELAEHNMLVDLGRNDLGKISRIGTVEVENYLSIERFSHVMHIGSSVRGTIREDMDAVDAVGAVLPAGTLSGAPKLRACEIIDELEGRRRGVYGGAVGYLDFTGNLDTCIAIRLAFRKNGRVTVRSGAGIVADSVPDKEFDECCNKARAVVAAIEQAQRGLE